MRRRGPLDTLRAHNGWTGGQYSVLRFFLGTYLTIHFGCLLPWAAELFSNRGMLPNAGDSPLIRIFPNILRLWDSPAAAAALVAVGAIASVLLTVGTVPKSSAVGAWYVLACLFGRNPLISNPSLPFVGWILLATTVLPSQPYGSWEARHRADAGTGWRMPQPLFLVAWVVLSIGYAYGGATKLVSPSWIDGTALARVLENPLARPGAVREALLSLPPILLKIGTWSALGLEVLFAPLALFRRTRIWVWTLMVAMHVGLLILVDFADLSMGMLMIHFFTFDPAWIHPLRSDASEWVFYDGHCGLCHRAVRLALSEDLSGRAFRFAPLHGETFRTIVPSEAKLPESLVVSTAQGALLTKSTAVLYILGRLGGLWRPLAALGWLVPQALRDAAYDAVARARHALFPPPPAACPIAGPTFRDRLGP